MVEFCLNFHIQKSIIEPGYAILRKQDFYFSPKRGIFANLMISLIAVIVIFCTQDGSPGLWKICTELIFYSLEMLFRGL